MIKISDEVIEAARLIAQTMPDEVSVSPIAKTGFFVTRHSVPGYTSWHSFKEANSVYEICWSSTS